VFPDPGKDASATMGPATDLKPSAWHHSIVGPKRDRILRGVSLRCCATTASVCACVHGSSAGDSGSSAGASGLRAASSMSLSAIRTETTRYMAAQTTARSTRTPHIAGHASAKCVAPTV
jgi:hypothetical protein